jgi:light-regulated signal transduction histidine kinase (bacteriophytochrome)
VATECAQQDPIFSTYLTRVADRAKFRPKSRTEAELRSYADVVAHDLSEPVAGISLLVRLLEGRAEEPSPPEVLRQHVRPHGAGDGRHAAGDRVDAVPVGASGSV